VCSLSFNKLSPGGVTYPEGFTASGLACGIKKEGRSDLALLYSEIPAVAAGVFTRNLFKAAPVRVTRERMNNSVHALVVNSGNANACTGEQGWNDSCETARIAARYLKVPEESVLVSSTGVIGELLPVEKLKKGLEKATLSLAREGGHQAAEAILTTDTVTKEIALQVERQEGSYHLGGMAKGSGMVCPRMATMLAFLTTDVEISRELLQEALTWAVERSFNLISIDGDTSTNDMVLVMSNGASGIKINHKGAAYRQFCHMLNQACRELSYRIVKDGEGTARVIALRVKGAPDFCTARSIARTVLNSLLVKTAFFGEDANWGRIFMALGNSEVKIDPDKIDLYLGNLKIASKSRGVAFKEKDAAEVLKQKEVPVTIDLNQGEEEILTWGSDLSYQYITINAAYRT